MSNNKIIFIFLSFILFITSCSSVKHPVTVSGPLNYSDENIVDNEIKRIDDMLATEPVRALWRSVLLGKKDIIEKTSIVVENLLKEALEKEDYYTAKKYFISLTAIGWENKEIDYTRAKLEELCSKETPGKASNGLAPASISECMTATVTIWVDRGVKVKNGAGYADIIIGSGFFIDKRGYIITNHHVIESMVDPKYEGYSRLYIKLLEDPDTKIPAKVVGYDSTLDLALLKVEITPKVVLNLGSSKELQLGDKISAIGTPVGLEGTITSGIISSTERKLFTLGNVFQIDAAVNSGNSGGPLLDANMNVQAIVFAGMISYQGLNFAIPVEYLKQTLNQLYSRDKVEHSWLGCYGHTYRSGNLKRGLEIQYVMPGGSAAMVGLVPGDIIVSVDGNSVSALEDFQYIIMGYEPDTILQCEYIDKDGNSGDKYIYLEKRPEAPSKQVFQSDFIETAFIPLFGMKLIPSSTTNKNSYTIEQVIKGSTAEEMHFSDFDYVIVRDVKIDDKNSIVLAQIYAKRRKKGFLDISMSIASQYDNPYYF